MQPQLVYQVYIPVYLPCQFIRNTLGLELTPRVWRGVPEHPGSGGALPCGLSSGVEFTKEVAEKVL